MLYNPRGLALILSVEQGRAGGKVDRERMETLLGKLKFEVRTLVDPEAVHEVHDAIGEAARSDHSEHDCLMVVAMCHGSDGQLSFGGRNVDIRSDLLAPFKGDRVPSLRGKP